MKIKLIYNSNNVLSGYTNIDIVPGENKTQGELHNLNRHVDNNQATEIIAENVLEYYKHEDCPGILENWIKKLRHGGKLTIVTTDIRSLSRLLVSEQVNLKDCLNFIFGSQNNELMFKKSIFTMDYLAEIMTNFGLSIIYKNINNGEIVITGQRK